MCIFISSFKSVLSNLVFKSSPSIQSKILPSGYAMNPKKNVHILEGNAIIDPILNLFFPLQIAYGIIYPQRSTAVTEINIDIVYEKLKPYYKT